jgi:hypothetical protein
LSVRAAALSDGAQQGGGELEVFDLDHSIQLND